ncbi:unnamed protein product [Peronospora destructor]|uniref:EF-hand domain-containing protein n=1 Tax=Peronospora destructor TaxID=86335 RepID=A0AAV0SW19_9STRA|nr:unnamed protein product [Peronospora destructor]
MVAEDNIGGTYGNTVNRIGGLVAGTVVPSIFSFFVCAVVNDDVYNTLNNIVLFVWTVGSICRNTSVSTTVSYASLTQNALARNVTGPLTEEDIETANALLSRTRIKALKFQMKTAIPELLKTQAKLLNGSTMKQTLWKPPFSTSKYTKVLGVCRELLERIDVFVDLIYWHENRQSNGKVKLLRRWHQSRIDAECTAAFTAAQEPPSPTSAVAEMVGEESARIGNSFSLQSPSSPLPNITTSSPAVAKIKWDQSLAIVEVGIVEAFDTLATTLFGEEFSGSNAEDHAIYLQMKEAFRIADVHRRGVVAWSFVGKAHALVDKDNDGKISFNEFMQALNEGFRLELEIYDDQPQVDVVTPNGVQSTHSVAFACFVEAHFDTALSNPCRQLAKVPHLKLYSTSRLLFTLTEAAMALKVSYGECLLGYVDDHSKRVTMEDFILMSCVISACENIAENLTRLNTVAAS